MNNKISKYSEKNTGFSLAEVLASLTIGSMILVAGISLYRRVENSAAAVAYQLGKVRIGSEVLQRIAEDLDRIIAPGPDTKISIISKTEQHGYSTARLIISRSYYDDKNRKQSFEEITWVSSYDFDSADEGLMLYRCHSGIVTEDELLSEEKQDWEKELYIPIGNGVTYFRIQVPKPKSDELLDEWSSSTMPKAIVVTISFAKPFRTVTGNWDVVEEEKITRTIAIDRTRKIKFVFDSNTIEEE